MPDYKRLYYDLFYATAQASELLLQAQQQAEEAFMQERPALAVYAKKQMPTSLEIKKQPLPDGEGLPLDVKNKQ